EIDLTCAAADLARAHDLFARFEDAVVGGNVFVERLADHRSISRRTRKALGGWPNSGSSNGGKPAHSRARMTTSLIRWRRRRRVATSVRRESSAWARSIKV